VHASQRGRRAGKYALAVQRKELEQYREFVYPAYGTPLMESYDRRFEAVLILLHPFIRVPEHLAWSATRRYPTDAEIVANGLPCTWSEVARDTRLNACARLNQALLTATGSLTGELADREGRDSLQHYLESHSIWMPAQGRFEPLLQGDLLRLFVSAGCDCLIHVPEFPDHDPIVSHPVSGLQEGSSKFPGCGTLVAPDASFLLTVEWDSFFTLFYGAREFLSEIAAERRLEGFFASGNTEHAWFNYSMGCATVTVSPEHW